MVFGRELVLGVALSVATGCTAKPEPPQDQAADPTGARDEVELLVTARPRVDVGESLALELRVRNGTDEVIELVRPTDGSGPRIELEWTDEAGATIRDPLGFVPQSDCGVIDPPTSEDRFTVAAGETGLVARELAPGFQTVLDTARPGRYLLRVRYRLGGDKLGALESAPVPVEITGGDAAMWSCRDAQLASRGASGVGPRSVHVEPFGLVARSKPSTGFVLGVVVVGRSRIELIPLDEALEPVGEARPVPFDGSIARSTLVRTGDAATAVVVVDRPNEGARIEAVELGSSETNIIATAPGFAALLGADLGGDRFALAWQTAGHLSLAVLGPDAAPISTPIDPGEVVAVDLLVAGPGPSVFAIWRPDARRTLVRRFDADGTPLGDAFEPETDDLAPCVSAGIVGDSLELVWSGMHRIRRTAVTLDGAPLDEREGIEPWDARPTAWAWRGRELGFIHGYPEFELVGPGWSTTLEVTRQYEPLLAGDPGGWVALWRDTRTDDSPACTLAERCVSEVFGARLDPRGRVVVGPKQLTSLAVPVRSFVPDQDQWRRVCAHEFGRDQGAEQAAPHTGVH